MKYLPKEAPEPVAFVDSISELSPDDNQLYRKTSYISLLKKVNLRRFLISEQHGLCLYCQSQIELTTSLIEHYLPQSTYRTESLTYTNLYAGCDCDKFRGHTNNKDKFSISVSDTEDRFCGHHKDSTELTWSPVKELKAFATTTSGNPYFEVNTETGVVKGIGENEGLVNEFIQICNLNHKLLKRARSEAFKAVTESGLTLKEMIICVASNPELAYNQFILNGLVV